MARRREPNRSSAEASQASRGYRWRFRLPSCQLALDAGPLGQDQLAPARRGHVLSAHACLAEHRQDINAAREDQDALRALARALDRLRKEALDLVGAQVARIDNQAGLRARDRLVGDPPERAGNARGERRGGSRG